MTPSPSRMSHLLPFPADLIGIAHLQEVKVCSYSSGPKYREMLNEKFKDLASPD